MNEPAPNTLIARRFRGFLPVIIDVETGGRHALAEMGGVVTQPVAELAVAFLAYSAALQGVSVMQERLMK